MTTEGGGWTVRTCFVLATKIDGGPIYVLFSIKWPTFPNRLTRKKKD